MKSYRQLCYDVDKDKYYLLKNTQNIQCDGMGKEAQRFIPYGTGIFDYEKRMQYSTNTGRKHAVPSKPLCYINQVGILDPCSFSGINKINGYAQFPRPISIRTGSLIATSRAFTSLKQDSNLSRDFLTQRNFESFRQLPKVVKKKPIESLTLLQNTQGLPSKKTLKNSLIKEDYMKFLPPTFRTFNNLDNFPEDLAKTLRKEEVEEMRVGERGIKGKVYSEIQMRLAEEAKELKEYQPLSEKKERVKIKGLYLIDIPKEGDLFERAKMRRDLVNPEAVAKERMQEELDLRIMQKNRQQKIVKNATLLPSYRSKEKKQSGVKKIMDNQ